MKNILLLLAGMVITVSLSLIKEWDRLVVAQAIEGRASMYLIATIGLLIWGLWA